jgi:hypothetical protein
MLPRMLIFTHWYILRVEFTVCNVDVHNLKVEINILLKSFFRSEGSEPMPLSSLKTMMYFMCRVHICVCNQFN